MMAENRLMKMFFLLLLQFAGALSADLFLSLTVRDGDEVTLPCGNVIRNHQNCDTTTWLFSDSRRTAAVLLVNLGQIIEKSKSDRLSVTADCSLIIKKVTDEDVGSYTCRQFRRGSGRQEGQDAVVLLSVVIMTEQKNTDQVTLICSVSIYERCKHRVKWIHNSEDLDGDDSDIKTSQSPCSDTVTFLNHNTHISSYDFNCSVTTEDNKVQLFPFSPRSSGDEINTVTTIKLETTTENTRTELSEVSTELSGWSWFRLIVVSVGLAALITAVVVVNIWIRAGKKKQRWMKTRCEDDDGAVTYENVRSSDEL